MPLLHASADAASDMTWQLLLIIRAWPRHFHFSPYDAEEMKRPELISRFAISTRESDAHVLFLVT
jgi:hypothetical protein